MRLSARETLRRSGFAGYLRRFGLNFFSTHVQQVLLLGWRILLPLQPTLAVTAQQLLQQGFAPVALKGGCREPK